MGNRESVLQKDALVVCLTTPAMIPTEDAARHSSTDVKLIQKDWTTKNSSSLDDRSTPCVCTSPTALSSSRTQSTWRSSGLVPCLMVSLVLSGCLLMYLALQVQDMQTRLHRLELNANTLYAAEQTAVHHLQDDGRHHHSKVALNVKERKERARRAVPEAVNRPHDRVTRDQVKQLINEARQTLYHPSAHLTPRRIGHKLDSAIGAEGVLRWTHYGSTSANITHNHLFRQDNNSTRLIVRESGTYYIYTQVTYTGRISSHITYRPCAHVLWLDGADGHRVSLLYSSTTQHKFGHVRIVDTESRDTFPYDSVYQGGVFQLYVDDALYIQLDMHSQFCRLAEHNDKTFIGAFLVQRSLDSETSRA